MRSSEGGRPQQLPHQRQLVVAGLGVDIARIGEVAAEHNRRARAHVVVVHCGVAVLIRQRRLKLER